MTSEPMLYDLTASEIVQRIRGKDLSAVELVRALLARIEELEPRLQVWVTLASEQALAEAEASDRAVAAGQAGLLQGVPVGVKDIIDVAGLPTTAGFTPFSERVPARDAAIVAGLRAAGAIMLGKTQTTQFAVGDPAPTENPWNRERTPGGSSAGSGAAVAARMVPVALGTQTAGSTLRPAAYCGVAGFKPSFNWISRRGVLPLAWSLDHVGLIARSVGDLALVYGALIGGPTEPGALQAPSRPRLALLTAYVERAEPDVQAHLTETAERLRAAGAEVVALEPPVAFELIAAVHHVIMESEVAALHAENLARQTEHYGPVVRRAAEMGQLIPAAYELKARRLRRRVARQVAAALAGFDAFLLPTVSNVAPAPATRTTGDPSFQAPWTLLGMPAVTLPTGLSEERLPIGTQLVGARGEDLALLAVAAWCADALGTIAPPEIEVPELEPAWVPSPPPDLEFEPVETAAAAAPTVADLTDDSESERETPMATTAKSLPGGVMLPGAKVGVTTPQGKQLHAHGVSGGVARPAARISSEPTKDKDATT